MLNVHVLQSKRNRMDASLLETATFSFWAMALIVRGGALLAAWMHLAGNRAPGDRRDTPPVSVIIPLAAAEAGREDPFESVFDQVYPEFEVLITSSRDDSAGIKAARRVAERRPDVPVRFLTGNPRRTHNPKVSNLAPAVAEAAHDLILVKDAGVTLPPGHLETMVGARRPGVGLVCTLPVGVRPEGLPAEIECAMTNALAAPWLLGGASVGVDIGFGKVMLVGREDLRRADGLSAMATTFGDDHALAKALARIGLRSVFSGGVAQTTVGRRTLRQVWDRQLRWMLIRRRESPLVFLIEPLATAGAAALAGALAAPVLGVPGWVLGGVTALAWGAGDLLFVARRGWADVTWRFPLAVIFRELLILALWMRAWTARRVVWAGEEFDLVPSSRPTG